MIKIILATLLSVSMASMAHADVYAGIGHTSLGYHDNADGKVKSFDLQTMRLGVSYLDTLFFELRKSYTPDRESFNFEGADITVDINYVSSALVKMAAPGETFRPYLAFGYTESYANITLDTCGCQYSTLKGYGSSVGLGLDLVMTDYLSGTVEYMQFTQDSFVSTQGLMFGLTVNY